MRTMCSREILTRKSRQQQNFDSDLKGAWHYNHVTFTPIAKMFLLYCRLIYMLSILCVKLTIKAKVGIPESFKVGWYRQKITGSSHLKWNSLADRRAKQLKSLMFKTVNNLVPEHLSDKFASVYTIHRHNLRGAQHNLFILRPNTEALKKSFRYRGAVTWNSLTAEAKQAITLNSFYSAIVF